MAPLRRAIEEVVSNPGRRSLESATSRRAGESAAIEMTFMRHGPRGSVILV
jgi:hypothetical protein